MGYQDPKDLRRWAGISAPDEDTDPNLPLFNWEEIDLAKPVGPTPHVVPATLTILIEISMYADKASSGLAQKKALQRFLDISKHPISEVKYTSIKKEEENVLFSSIKKVYTIEIVAHKEASLAYYRNIRKIKSKGMP